MKAVIRFIKKETVLSVAWILAFVSMFFVTPSAEYIEYIDFRSLGILWSLMIIMAGLQDICFFEKVGQKLLKRARNALQLSLILIMLCFFSSMFITNDVALITFVPFAMFMLKSCDRLDLLIPVVAFQTLAANLGSMLTPIGNPQNLYLFNLSKLPLINFMMLMLPYSVATLIILVISVMFLPKKTEPLTCEMKINSARLSRRKLSVYMVLFLMALLAVSNKLPWYILAGAVFAVILIMDRKILAGIDYALLFTFAGFFIFTGNIGKIPATEHFLSNVISGHEMITGIFASQFISNVPAALLLSGFTNNYENLILGVNLGGLGTLIASMASLISFKLLAHSYNEKKGRYFAFFTVVNVLYLVILLLLAVVKNQL